MRFAFTTRFTLLVLCGALPLMLARSWPAAVALFVATNAALAALFWLDLRVTPGAGEIDARRLAPAKLSIGEPNEIVLEVMNRSRKTLRLTVLEEAPAGFAVDARAFPLVLAPRTIARLVYRATPPARGDYAFGDIVVVWRGLLDLALLDARIGAARPVKVYPNIRAVSRFEFSVRHSHLVETGLTTERRRGEGTEFESLKEYGRDDEFRKIDWKATARRQKLIAREFQTERNQSVIVALDVSRPMGVAAGDGTLLDAAVNAALLLGYVVTRRQDRIGLVAFSDRVRLFLPPKSGKGQFIRFLDALYNLQPEPAEPDYEALYRHVANGRLRRSLLVLLTDLSAGSAPERVRKGCAAVIRRHLPLLVSITDPKLPALAAAPPATEAALYRAAVAREQIERGEAAAAEVARLGFLTLTLPPDQLAPTLLSSYLRQKQRGRL